MAAVAVFDDMACSTPTQITFTQNFGCSVVQDPFNSVCGPSGPTQYSISTCTSDFSSFTETTFSGSTRYLAVEKHSDSGCMTLQSVTVYVADGSCHANLDDGTSFIVNLNADGSGTIALYLDSYCSQPGESEEVTKQMVTHYTCAQDFSGCVDGSCSKRYFIGGFGGPPAKGIMTAVSVYSDASCSSPATTMKFSRELSCTPQLNPLEPECGNLNGVYSSSDCEVYTVDGWDSSGLIQQAFGGHTHLTVQEFDTSFGECAGTDALIQATVYLLDEECHPNRDSTASTKLTFGRSLTITTSCVGGGTRALLSSWPDLTAVAVFEGEDCTERPVKMQFTQLFGCSVEEDPVKSVCGPDGSSHYSISSCTRDCNGLATTTFGSTTPYLMVEEFADYFCSRLQNVNVYTADGSCHTNADDTTSFMATISKDGSATITTFLDSSCSFVDDSTNLSKRKLVDSSTCYHSDGCTVDGGLCSTRISYGGMGGPPSKGQMTAVIFYGADYFCSQPADLVEYTRELVCAPHSNYWNWVCEGDGELHFTSYCTIYWSTGSDNYGLLDRAFGSNAYLLVEEYDLSFGYCGDSYTVDSVAAYHLLDEECHKSRDGTTSYRLTLGHTVVITKYDDSVCTATSSQTEVSWRTANRSPCINASPTQATRFSQDFICGATLHPEKAVCGAEGTAFYSIASCTSDYSGLADTLLGTDLPYIMVEEFDDYYCGLVQEVTVYTADGSCHSSTDGMSSFMATLTPDGSATITTYSDTMCSVVEKTTTQTRRELLAYSCLQDSNECANEDGWSCSKRISVGGLGGMRSQGLMISVASYNLTGCPPPASTVAFTRGLICTHQSNGASPVCEDNDTVSFSSDCLLYNLGGWNSANSYIGQALGWSQPYILVEEYDESVSMYPTLANSTAYLLDSACHANHEGTASTRLTLGISLTITEYDDSYCEIVSMETEVTFAEAYHNAFIDNRIITYLRGGTPDLSAVAVCADNACSELPVKLTLTQYFQCNGEQDLTKTVCEPSNAKLYSTSSCTRDYFALAKTVFGGDNPYVVVEEYSDRWCELVQNVTVYAADGVCHANDDGVTSFRVTLTSDRSVTITRYSDVKCKNVEDSESRRWEILSYSCIQTSDCVDAARYGCSKSSCSQPAETVSITRDLVCKPSDAAVCKATDSGDLYSVSQCVSVAHPWNTLDEAFGWHSHLVVGEYDTSIGSCWAREGLAGLTAYLLDEECHVNSFGTASSKLTFGESLTLTTYDDSSCSSVSSEKEVTWNMVMYGCADDKTMYYLRGVSPDLTAVAVYRDKSCTGTPTKLELTRRFGCNADQDPSQSTCTSDGSMVYSVSSCVGNYMYPDYALTKFGTDTPYLIEERFVDMWCSQIQSVTVYIADGSCQSNTDGMTSFVATISVDNQATLVKYSDASVAL
ncbi:hypothetical protein PF010_g13960 [Phytophthora fragariae]|uniref:Uncharacterized protein n=2 Tax=Phytophthora fragariae TaxID=53985 RepID=A0A6G0KZ54_9STRA|nr:hypothetical protein PF010_g13960 [Phytophthora fragariae]